MLQLRMKADTLVCRCCWCTPGGGARVNSAGDDGQVPPEHVLFNLDDDFNGSPDFFRGNGGVGALCATTAGRGSDKQDSFV